jgi:OOP family OmpA-OmpF porin
MTTLKKSLLFSFLFLFSLGNAQNLVLNPGFEDLIAPQRAKVPECQYTKFAKDFTSTVKGWNTFKGLTPDVILYPDTLADCIYPRPRTGQGMTGLILYHPAEDTGYPSDFHEMIQGKFIVPLAKGQRYELSLWVMQSNAVAIDHLRYIYNPKANIFPVSCNNLGVLFLKNPFGDNEIIQQSISQFDIRPHIVFEEVVTTPKDEWVQLKTSFVAKANYEYFVLGNFSSDFRTDILPDDFRERYPKPAPGEKILKRATRVAYYCIDDVSVTLAKPDMAASLSAQNRYTFENVHFENGKADLLEDALQELDQLAGWLKENPGKKAEIGGHTDSVGSEQDNLDLSERRAKAVYDYLVQQGVPADRITFKGYGESEPVADNKSLAGRRTNRRVECKLLED